MTLQTIADRLGVSRMTVSNAFSRPDQLSEELRRKIMLTARWREVGLSAVHVPSAPGTFGGREVTIVTADFGVRR